jgi:plastocyanin
MRQLRWLGLAVAAVAAAGLAGCGADSGGGFATPTFQKAGPPANRGGPVTLTMDNIAFMPAQATARVGQTVTWSNQDGVPHTVTATSGATFKSRIVQQGQSFSYRPVKVGTIQYVCTIHPNMRGTLQVVG